MNEYPMRRIQFVDKSSSLKKLPIEEVATNDVNWCSIMIKWERLVNNHGFANWNDHKFARHAACLMHRCSILWTELNDLLDNQDDLFQKLKLLLVKELLLFLRQLKACNEYNNTTFKIWNNKQSSGSREHEMSLFNCSYLNYASPPLKKIYRLVH